METNDTDRRIATLERLTPEDWTQFISELLSKSEDDRQAAYQLRITYDLVNALHQMDRNSTLLARRLVVLTWVLVVFTAVLLIEPLMHLYEHFPHVFR